MPLSYIIPLMW